MKIVFAGGITGGHFYPIIAVAEELRSLAEEQNLLDLEFFFISNDPYNSRVLFEHNIKYVPCRSGKLRRYFSLANFFDFFKTGYGLVEAFFKLYSIYPDIVFSKGGSAAFPVLLAARLLMIPVVIHESDSKPGRVSLWSSKFAKAIAVSYPEAAKYFKADKTAVTGNPIRRELLNPSTYGAYEYLQLDKNSPTILILGGSQGAVRLNDLVLDLLPELLNKYQVIHQTGQKNLSDAQKRADFLLAEHPHRERYKMFPYLNEAGTKMSAGVADLVISRAGSTIFEIAQWGIPSIIIPIPESISHDQTSNAYTYARSGGASVIEEKNLTGSILLAEIERLMSSPDLLIEMKQGAKNFARPEAARLIAQKIITLATSHED